AGGHWRSWAWCVRPDDGAGSTSHRERSPDPSPTRAREGNPSPTRAGWLDLSPGEVTGSLPQQGASGQSGTRLRVDASARPPLGSWQMSALDPSRLIAWDRELRAVHARLRDSLQVAREAVDDEADGTTGGASPSRE